MADEEHPDARDHRVASWLAAEPLDEVTRRRLVRTAVREGAPSEHRSSRPWRVTAAVAAAIIVVAGVFAVVTANGGHDEQRASTPVHTPSGADEATTSLAAVPHVGDFGDLDDAANLSRLRQALARDTNALSDTTARAESSAGAPAPSTATSAPTCPLELPPGSGEPIAAGTGTLDGRRATVVVFGGADGTRSYRVLLEDPCELRTLP
jgi:hypothetical protein